MFCSGCSKTGNKIIELPVARFGLETILSMLNHSSFQKRCVGQRNGQQSQKLKMNSVSDSGEHQSLEVLFLRSAVAAAALLLLF
jgi:hypothetical protein